MAFCIPKQYIKGLKKAVSKVKITKMGSEARRELFASKTNKELGKEINTEFEKAIASGQEKELTKWAEMAFKGKRKETEIYQSLKNKIERLEKLGAIDNDEFYEDLISDELGVSITGKEANNIMKKAGVMDDAFNKVGDNIGNPKFYKESKDFLKTKRKLDDYMDSLNPSSNFAVLSQNLLGRPMMLLSVKSPLTNVISNTVAGGTNAFSKRLSRLSAGTTDNKLAMDYVKNTIKMYNDTGYDVSRMLNISEGRVLLGEKITHSQGKGFIRKGGRAMENLIYNKLLGLPDVASSAIQFADTANLMSRKIVKEMGFSGKLLKKKGREIMQDAMSVTPQTMEGGLIREQAIADAMYATFTNEGNIAKFALALRSGIDKMTGKAKLGQLLIPFVKTPANVIEQTLDYAGLGTLKSIPKFYQGVKSGEKKLIQEGVDDVVKSGVGITAAVLFANSVKPDDFVGEYDPQRQKIESLRNSTYNAIRIGNKWISMDYFGPLAAPLTGIMYAKKYGNNPKTFITGFASASASMTRRIPGWEEASTWMDLTQKAISGSEGQKAGALNDMMKTANNMIRARVIPGIVSDLVKAGDTKRDTTVDNKYKQLVNEWMLSLPILRQKLPEKATALGDVLEESGIVEALAFGARVRTNKEDNVVDEIVRLRDAGQTPTVINLNYSSSEKVGRLKEKVGEDKFKEVAKEYGVLLRKNYTKVIDKSKYGKMSDEDKKKELDHARLLAMEDIYDKYKIEDKKRAKARKYLLK